jgi:hypothetical protein
MLQLPVSAIQDTPVIDVQYPRASTSPPLVLWYAMVEVFVQELISALATPVTMEALADRLHAMASPQIQRAPATTTVRVFFTILVTALQVGLVSIATKRSVPRVSPARIARHPFVTRFQLLRQLYAEDAVFVLLQTLVHADQVTLEHSARRHLVSLVAVF